MRLFGLTVTKAATLASASPVPSSRAWWPLIRDWKAGAWQRNQEWSVDTVLAHHAVFSCVTLIANDVGKLRLKLVEQDEDGIWSEVREQSPFLPVLAKPNRYQTRIQFIEFWITSKLVRGNTYVLKERDARGIVRALYCLDPSRVQVLVAPDGSVYYRLSRDDLAELSDDVTVPASEIIHDRMNCLFHPLVGLAPIFASGVAANLGLKIQGNSSNFFGNGSNPSGILTAPGKIDGETAKRIKEHWDTEYSGDNAGKVAVLGDGLKFEGMRMSAVDSQLIEQLRWSAETIASTFHVPTFKIGVGTQPTYQNGEILNQIYYSDCLQSLIEQLELCLDEGLGLTEVSGRSLGVEMDLDSLLRMDTATQIRALGEGVKAGIMAPNEGRRKLDLKPVPGGNTPYLQQQNYSLEALDKRDRAAPAPSDKPPAPPTPEPEEKVLRLDVIKSLGDRARRKAGVARSAA